MATILLIDDDEPFADSVRRILEAKGFQVQVAPDGQKGLELARTRSPDLVLCDVFMDTVDGYEVLDQLRHAAPTAGIPIILTTGHPDFAGLLEGIGLGADEYLPKPFTAEGLVAAINTRLRQQQARQRAEADRASDPQVSLELPREIEAPLAGILSAAELLVKGGRSWKAGEIEAYAGLIKRSGGRLRRLVSHSLIYAQIELLATHPDRVAELRRVPPLSLPDALGRVARACAGACRRANDLELTLAPAAASISEPHLAAIASELIENAFTFSTTGSPVRVGTQAKSDCVLVQVVDHGCGLGAAQLQRALAHVQFARQLHEPQGLRLGLAIARRLAELYGGTLTIKSQAGEGTEVEVRLPAAGG